jgi:bifunctional non-homologous end joining protein LigD
VSGRRGDPLDAYRRKRNFAASPEPPAERSHRTRPPRLRFVVQKHRASHLHYDFRLEAGGVLKSWAVPKGPTLDPSQRRLAMHVEDHPLEYRNFEGVIPAPNYGAGEVIVWDRGTYTLAEGTNPVREIAKGRIKFVLHGKKLKGLFTLVRMRPRDGSQNAWLLIKDKDRWADARWRPEAHDASVKSGRTLDELARGRAARRRKARA